MKFKLWLMENAGSGTKELYHATLSGPNNEILNSFIQGGIDPQKSKGYFQGVGFYLFQNKKNAISQAKNIADSQNSVDFKKEVPVQGSPIIIVSDEPITPECFDIDYEVFGHAFARFFHDHEDYFRKNAATLNLWMGKKNSQFKRMQAAFNADQVPESPLSKGSVRFSSLHSDDMEMMAYNPEQGGQVSKFAEKLAKFDPEMFNKFESEYLYLSPAIKYNCKKKIWPLRIEDINGKVLWNRSV